MSTVSMVDEYNVEEEGGLGRLVKEHIYRNGRYDRREREFYGFEFIQAIDRQEPEIRSRISIGRQFNNITIVIFSEWLLTDTWVVSGDVDFEYPPNLH